MKTTAKKESKENHMDMNLKGKVALVTGGTRGIGYCIAEKLARRGCNVIINYFRSRQSANEAVERLEKYGVECYAHRANIGNLDQLPPLFEKIHHKFGKLDIFISNAALGSFTSMMDIDDKSWHLAMDTNARAFLRCMQLAVPIMPRGGKITALSSLGSTRYIPGYASIAVSKAAIENIVKFAAVELAPKGINVNCVCGGFIDTDSLKVFPNREELLREAIERTPFKRVGLPDEVADVAVFMVSDMARWITGQTLIVDGGYTLL
ncbi:MAG: SDR family oxidoreductase [Candidatus Zixiibacteriota bacterium]